MKTTDTAINQVHAILTGSGGVSVPVYKLSKPTGKKESEYIVLNALPITHGVLQKCRVNVNYHCADLKPGIPDMEKLEDMTSDLMALLTIVSTTAILIDFESQEYHRESQLNEHYSNIRLIVKIIN